MNTEPKLLGPYHETEEPRKFRWWFKGITPEKNICRFEGTGYAKSAAIAADNVEKMMRKNHPEITWMQGKQIEGVGANHGVTFGPTVQMLKGKKRP